MSQTLAFTLNGEVETPQAAPTVTLLEYLRGTGRIGTKEGCGDGDCGRSTRPSTVACSRSARSPGARS
jgi:xanthine dehydrogenase iron-sulfur cluster and FAD-binding subunit A